MPERGSAPTNLQQMRVALLTREFPPEVYGGAGVHVEYLGRELAGLVDLAVYCFGEPRPSPLVAAAFKPWTEVPASAPGAALGAMSVDLLMAGAVEEADLAHSHTWYANLAGHLAKLMYGIPHVVTAHSLEPLRPWKAEQLGAGYALSSWCERTSMESADAIIAVSEAMRTDILAVYPTIEADRVVVIHNGIDPDQYRLDSGTDVLAAHGIDPDLPSVMFIGRITRQKGIGYLLDAASSIDPSAQLVLCAGAPDTPEIGAEMSNRAKRLQARRGNVFWIEEMLPRGDVIQLLSHADVFVCPSIYEPFGLINLEAMACGVPVVASATGGIPEIVVPGETGELVYFEPGSDALGSPLDPEAFADGLARAVNGFLGDRDRARSYGQAGRDRVLEHFTWSAIAATTVGLYGSLL